MSRKLSKPPSVSVALAVSAVLAAAALAAEARPAAAPAELSIAAFNGRYSQPGVAFDGVTVGPLAMRLSSPENAVYVDRHTVRLSPLGDGTHRAELTAAVRGGGRLVADLEVAGAPSRMADRVVLPPQTVTVEGRARFERVEGGWEIGVSELPPTVGLEIESALADRLVTLCEGLRLIALGAVDCAAIERSLRFVQAPLPAAGQTLYLAADQLAAGERRALEDYLTTEPTERSGAR